MTGLQAFKRYLARQSERPVGPKSYEDVLHEAQAMIASAAEDGIEIDKSARQAVLKAVAEDQAGRTTSALQEELYAAYTQLAEQASEVSKRDAGARSFGNALIDAEQLIRYAAEVGTPVDAATSTDIFGARTAFNDGEAHRRGPIEILRGLCGGRQAVRRGHGGDDPQRPLETDSALSVDLHDRDRVPNAAGCSHLRSTASSWTAYPPGSPPRSRPAIPSR